MTISRIIKIIMPLILFFFFTSPSFSESRADNSRATVKIDSLEVHSEMSENSKVLTSLKKGDIVKVEFEMDGSGGTWCGITEEGQSDVRGYVPCRDLNQEVRQGKTWQMINSTGIREGAKESSSVGRHEMDKLLQSKWTGLKDALRNGDIRTALTYIAISKRSEYEKVFRSLYVPLAQIDKVLTDITLIEMSAADAEYQMVRTDARGRTAYMVRFGIDEDGVWRIYGF